MVNNSYQMVMKIYGTKEGIDKFNQSKKSQSSEPSDGFQDYWTDNNKQDFESYELPNNSEQNTGSREERCKKEYQLDRALFMDHFNAEKSNK